MYHIGNAKIYLFHIKWNKPQMWKKSIFWILFFKMEKNRMMTKYVPASKAVLQIIA